MCFKLENILLNSIKIISKEKILTQKDNLQIRYIIKWEEKFWESEERCFPLPQQYPYLFLKGSFYSVIRGLAVLMGSLW